MTQNSTHIVPKYQPNKLALSFAYELHSREFRYGYRKGFWMTALSFLSTLGIRQSRDLFAQESFDLIIMGGDELLNLIACLECIKNNKRALLVGDYANDLTSNLQLAINHRYTMLTPSIGRLLKSYYGNHLRTNSHADLLQDLSEIVSKHGTDLIVYANNFVLCADDLRSSVRNSQERYFWPTQRTTHSPAWTKTLRNMNANLAESNSREARLVISGKKTLVTSLTPKYFWSNCEKHFIRVGEAIAPISTFSWYSEKHRLRDIVTTMAINEICNHPEMALDKMHDYYKLQENIAV